jgi:broad specificity phosphatase PhoE
LCSAGVRDSLLTSHGVQQAIRLGKHFAYNGTALSHVYSSDLRRAYKTAELVKEHQIGVVEHTVLSVLREQDFGSLEGKSWTTRVSEKDSHASRRSVDSRKTDDSTYIDVESKASMALRMDEFLNKYLLPSLFMGSEDFKHSNIAVVSHGIILGVLWKRLLSKFGPNTVSFALNAIGTTKPVSLEHLGGWSNTGYLELDIIHSPSVQVDAPIHDGSNRSLKNSLEPGVSEDSKKHATPSIMPVTGTSPLESILLHGWRMRILAINGKMHLIGLKRTRGGLGSAQYDDSQKTIDNFFKRQKKS